jgi:cobalt/nickel transport protein
VARPVGHCPKRISGPALLASALLLASTASASAHFQLIWSGRMARMPGGAQDVLLIFTHAFKGAPTMSMGQPRALYMLRQPAGTKEVEKTDLMKVLEPFTFVNDDKSEVAAFRVPLQGQQIRSMGDYVMVLEPEPFLEETEGKYIQQFSKLVMNVGGVPNIWDKDVGLPAEIRPLNKPYANWPGGVFRGVVLSKGKPVPFAEIEVEYLNRVPDPSTRGWSGQPKVKAPHPSLGTLSMKTDASGNFAVGLPKSGWWGIAALGVGPQTQWKGKPLSQDAVIWVEAAEMN